MTKSIHPRFIVIFLLTLFSYATTVAQTITFTPEEQKWMDEHPVIRVRAYGNYQPFFFPEKHKNSLVKEILKELDKALPITFEYSEISDWEQSLQALEDKKIDLIPIITPTEARGTYANFTDKLLEFPTVIYLQKDRFVGHVQDLEGLKVAVVKSYTTTDKLQEKYPDFHYVFVDKPLQALQMVADGDADAYIGDLAVSNYMIEQNNLYDVKIASPSGFGSTTLAMGARKDWPELTSILNKVLHSTPPGTFREMIKKWLTVHYEYGATLKKVKIRAGIIIGSILIGLIVFIIWNRRLKQEIARRIQAESDLQNSQDTIQTLEGLIPICAKCKKIRNESELWDSMEKYIEQRSDAFFSHTVCPECSEEMYGGQPWFEKAKARMAAKNKSSSDSKDESS